MSFAMLWPIVLIVFSNVLYNICSKEVPQAINPLASLTVTYLVGAVFSGILFFALNRGGDLIQEYKHLNWTSIVLGLAIVGLEAGAIYMYKSGWNVSSGQLIHSILSAMCLVIIGIVFYREGISLTKVVGIAICMVGLYLINK